MAKTEQRYEKWVRQMFDKYKSILFLEKYHFKVEKGKETSFLEARFNYPYLDIVILYSDRAIDDWKKDKRGAERKMVHELCHTITDPFYYVVLNWPTKEAIENQRERLTDHISQIVNNHFNLL